MQSTDVEDMPEQWHARSGPPWASPPRAPTDYLDEDTAATVAVVSLPPWSSITIVEALVEPARRATPHIDVTDLAKVQLLAEANQIALYIHARIIRRISSYSMDAARSRRSCGSPGPG